MGIFFRLVHLTGQNYDASSRLATAEMGILDIDNPGVLSNVDMPDFKSIEAKALLWQADPAERKKATLRLRRAAFFAPPMRAESVLCQATCLPRR